jgi:hypothetical protein
MMPGEDDRDLLRGWRGTARETPGAVLDRCVLQAARAQAARRHLLPLAAALAACLALAVYAVLPHRASPPPVAKLDTSTFGLYEGRMPGTMADPEMTRQMILGQMPGASSTSEIVSR